LLFLLFMPARRLFRGSKLFYKRCCSDFHWINRREGHSDALDVTKHGTLPAFSRSFCCWLFCLSFESFHIFLALRTLLPFLITFHPVSSISVLFFFLWFYGLYSISFNSVYVLRE
jgi:hypothetical protein